MTIKERQLTFAYALVLSAQDQINHAYRVLAGDGTKIDEEVINRGFLYVDDPLDSLRRALAEAVSKRTDYREEGGNG